MKSRHEYQVAIEWQGNAGSGTQTYSSYERPIRSRQAAGQPLPVGLITSFGGILLSGLRKTSWWHRYRHAINFAI